jgi:hypothetical protein
MVNVRWIDGFMVNSVSNENAGYLANTRADGASHIFLALSTNDNNTLDKSNKIVPADPHKTGCRWSKKRWMAAYLLITLAT